MCKAQSTRAASAGVQVCLLCASNLTYTRSVGPIRLAAQKRKERGFDEILVLSPLKRLHTRSSAERPQHVCFQMLTLLREPQSLIRQTSACSVAGSFHQRGTLDAWMARHGHHGCSCFLVAFCFSSRACLMRCKRCFSAFTLSYMRKQRVPQVSLEPRRCSMSWKQVAMDIRERNSIECVGRSARLPADGR